MKIKLPKYLKFVLKILISGLLLWYVFSKIDFNDVIGVIGQANFWLLIPALLFFILSKLISAFRLNEFFKSTGLNISNRYNIKLYILGMFYNLFLPGGIGGDGYKIYLLNRQSDVKAKDLFWATLLDRVTGVIALFVLTMFFLAFIPISLQLKTIGIILIPVSVFVAFIVIKKFFRKYKNIFLKSNIQSLAVQLSQVVSAIFILLSFNFTEHIPLFIVIFLISSIVAIFPFTLGGAGAREFTFALMGSWLVFDPGDEQVAIALGLTFYLITVITSLGGIYYHFNIKSLKN